VEHAAPDPGPAQPGRDVGGDDEDRLAVGPRLADRAERVGRARAGRGQRHAQAAGGARVAVRGVGGRLLVADSDEADRRFADRAPEREVVHAGQAERHFDARSLQRRDREAGACQDARPG
jgi:hypothetical protein